MNLEFDQTLSPFRTENYIFSEESMSMLTPGVRKVVGERARRGTLVARAGGNSPSPASFPSFTSFARSPRSPFTRSLQTESLGLDSGYPS